MAAPLEFLRHGTNEPLSQSEIEALCAAQAEAARALGKLDSALFWCPLEAARFIAVRLIRETLVSALRQEGHQFTDTRFHAWFAGLATLSDEALQLALAPRTLVTALLAEMTRSRWAPLAEAALDIESACLAMRDPHREMRHETAHEIVRASLDEAVAVVDALAPAPLPFAALAALHRALGQSPRFAPAERATETIALDNIQLVVERPRPPSPRWAVEWAFGEHLRASSALCVALPFNALIRLDTIDTGENDDNPADTAIVQAEAFRACLDHLNGIFEEAARTHQELTDHYHGKRSNSRAPQLYSLLNAFGPLRSSQIEAALGATRLGVRTMVAALSEAGDISIETVSGVKLYSVTRYRAPMTPTAMVDEACSFSSEALAEYDTSLANIDALLARYEDGSACET